MNEPDSKKIMAEAFQRLPPKVQEAVLSTELPKKFDALTKKYNLHIDQASALETETMLVMLDLEPGTNYLENIEKELRLTRDEAKNISDDVNELILKDIKGSLKVAYADEEEESADEPVRINAGPTMKNPGEEGDFSPNKEALLREIERPAEPIRMPVRSSGLSNMNERLRDRDMQVMTEAKHLDDLRRAETERKHDEAAAASKTPKKESDLVDVRMTKMVTAPKKEVEVKLSSAEIKPAVVDPYREAAN